MAQEFIARNGIIAQNNSVVSGSLIVTGGITGSLQGTASFASTSPITIGTTPITSGTIGRVLFEGAGNVVQEDSGLFWDNTNKRLGIGTITPASTLNIGGSGTLASGLTFGSGVSGIWLLDNTTIGIKINNVDKFWFRGTDFYPDSSLSLDLGLSSRRWKGLYTQQITDNGSNVLINTITDQGGKLQVKAGGALSTDIAFRVRNSADTTNLFYVTGLGGVFSHGSTGITSNIVYGSNTALQFSAGANNIVIGNAMGVHTNGSRNVGIGNNNTLGQNGDDCVAIGDASQAWGSNSVSIGSSASSAGANSVGIGHQVALYITAGAENVFLGKRAAALDSVGGFNTNQSTSVYIGYNTKSLGNTQTNQIVIGHNAVGLGSNSAVIGNSSTTLFRPYGNVAIGADTAAAKLDIRAQGALSTDIAFRVRNSADSATIGYIAGNGLILLGENASTSPTVIINPAGSTRLLLRGGTNQDITFSSSGFAVLNCEQGFDAVAGSAGSSIFRFRNGSGGNVSLFYGGLQIGTAQSAGTATNFTLIANGVAPSVNYTDSHYIYSADITAGNAAPHFRTEAGNIVKLYTQAAVTSAQGIADALTNLGFLTGSSVISGGGGGDTTAIEAQTWFLI